MREEMMMNVIRKFGFEDRRTVCFCKMAERTSSDFIVKLNYDTLMAENIFEEEEE